MVQTVGGYTSRGVMGQTVGGYTSSGVMPPLERRDGPDRWWIHLERRDGPDIFFGTERRETAVRDALDHAARGFFLGILFRCWQIDVTAGSRN
jgi:hypothetical protein